jgi:hypothetical protein
MRLVLLFEVPRAVPTIGLPLRLRLRVPHDEIDRGQDGAGERQDRGDKDHGFGHATTLITTSASAQTPIHSANTAIVPKATRPMPVIASLIDVSIFLTREPAYRLHQRGLGSAYIRSVAPTRPSELSAKSFRDFLRQEFVRSLDVRHATSSAFKGVRSDHAARSNNGAIYNRPRNRTNNLNYGVGTFTITTANMSSPLCSIGPRQSFEHRPRHVLFSYQ